MNTKLKPCPCCGGYAELFEENFGEKVWVQCTECGLSTSRYIKEKIVCGKNGVEWALNSWNRRCN